MIVLVFWGHSNKLPQMCYHKTTQLYHLTVKIKMLSGWVPLKALGENPCSCLPQGARIPWLVAPSSMFRASNGWTSLAYITSIWRYLFYFPLPYFKDPCDLLDNLLTLKLADSIYNLNSHSAVKHNTVTGYKEEDTDSFGAISLLTNEIRGTIILVSDSICTKNRCLINSVISKWIRTIYSCFLLNG